MANFLDIISLSCCCKGVMQNVASWTNTFLIWTNTFLIWTNYFFLDIISPPPAAAKVLCKTQLCRAFPATSRKYSVLQSGGRLNWRVNFELQKTAWTNPIFLPLTRFSGQRTRISQQLAWPACKLHNCTAQGEKETWYILPKHPH